MNDTKNQSNKQEQQLQQRQQSQQKQGQKKQGPSPDRHHDAPQPHEQEHPETRLTR
jgi:hypothetical protein